MNARWTAYHLYPSGSPRVRGKDQGEDFALCWERGPVVSHHSWTLSSSAEQVLLHHTQGETEVGKLAYTGQKKDLMSDLRDAPYVSVCVAYPGLPNQASARALWKKQALD